MVYYTLIVAVGVEVQTEKNRMLYVALYWDVLVSSLVCIHWLFRRTCYLCHQGR